MKTNSETNMLAVLDAIDGYLKVFEDAEVRLYVLGPATVVAVFDDVDKCSVCSHGPSVKVALAHLKELLCEKRASNPTSEVSGSEQRNGTEPRIQVSSA